MSSPVNISPVAKRVRFITFDGLSCMMRTHKPCQVVMAIFWATRICGGVTCPAWAYTTLPAVAR
jgi:hypothetical protein